MFAQWDDHEVTNDWWPGETSRRTMRNEQCLAAGGARPPRIP